MAHNGATMKEEMKEQTARHQPTMDVMVATFADRQAAKDAYKTLRSMDKEGAIDLSGAFVIDRDAMGRTHIEGAKLPGWVWGLIIGSSVLMLGMVAGLVWLGILAAQGAKVRRMARGEEMSTEYTV